MFFFQKALCRNAKCFLWIYRLHLVVGTENIDDLVSDHLLDLVSADLKVLSGVKDRGIVCEDASDTCRHGKAYIRVDVDLADRHLCGTAELILGDTDCIGHLAAETVDLSNSRLSDGGGTVENDRESGKSLFDLFKDIEAEGRRNKNAVLISCALFGSELVSTVTGTDGDREGVDTGAGDELFDLLGSV